MILNPHSDICPTGPRSVCGDSLRRMPLLSWFAAQRTDCARFSGRNVFDESMADIETMGLLKQAEAVRIESANTK